MTRPDPRSLGRRLLGGARRLGTDRSANTIVEFGIIAPIVLLLFLGIFDLSRYVLTVNKVHRAAATTADLIARFDKIHDSDITAVFAAITQVTSPIDITIAGGIIVSSISRNDASGGRKVSWQRKTPNTFSTPSKLGTQGNPPTFPTGFDLSDLDNAIFAEAFYTFAPFFLGKGFLGGPTSFPVYERIVFHPRLGTLSTVTPEGS